MKKLIIIAALFVLTGCSKTGGEILSESFDKMKDVKNYTMDMTAKVNVKQAESEININLPISLAYNEGKSKLTIGDNSFIGKQDIYLKNTKDMFSLYFKSDLFNKAMLLFLGSETNEDVSDFSDSEKWIFIEQSIKEQKDKLELNNIKISEIFKDDKFVYIDKDKNIKHYQMTIDNELIDRINSDRKEKIEQINQTVKLDVYIDSKTKYITKIDFDLKDALKGIDNFDADMVKEAKITFELSKLNNTSVDIDEKIIENAVSIEDYYSGYLE